MSVLVDDAAWPWRGERWAHLTSDRCFDELHPFANGLGVRRLAFQDDHYDVPSSLRDLAVARGAVPVTSRALVAALRAGGLRARGRRSRWVEVAFDAPFVAQALEPVRDGWPALAEVGWTTVLRRPGELALSVVLAPQHPLVVGSVPAMVADVAFIVERHEGRILDVVLPLAIG